MLSESWQGCKPIGSIGTNIVTSFGIFEENSGAIHKQQQRQEQEQEQEQKHNRNKQCKFATTSGGYQTMDVRIPLSIRIIATAHDRNPQNPRGNEYHRIHRQQGLIHGVVHFDAGSYHAMRTK